jgi:tricorn protease-like protein
MTQLWIDFVRYQTSNGEKEGRRSIVRDQGSKHKYEPDREQIYDFDIRMKLLGNALFLFTLLI